MTFSTQADFAEVARKNAEQREKESRMNKEEFTSTDLYGEAWGAFIRSPCSQIADKKLAWETFLSGWIAKENITIIESPRLHSRDCPILKLISAAIDLSPDLPLEPRMHFIVGYLQGSQPHAKVDLVPAMYQIQRLLSSKTD